MGKGKPLDSEQKFSAIAKNPILFSYFPKSNL